MKRYYEKFLTDDTRNSVIFAGEIVGNMRREYYRWCDMSVTPSIGSESFGITLLESMGCAKPVVATDIPAFRFVMSEDEGIFCRTCDHEDLARAVLELYHRKKDWQRIGKAGRTKALSLSWSKVAGLIEDIFVEIIVPAANSGIKCKFIKSAIRKSIDFPLVNCAVAVETNNTGVKNARICLNSVYTQPYRVIKAEDYLKGKPIDEATAEEAASQINDDTIPLLNNRYKIQIARALIKRAILACG